MVTHLNPLDQESERFLRETHGHSVGFLVPMRFEVVWLQQG